ncbi:hypothetical protein WR25_23257 [Diploscapter pachys]|uniref:Uncharacterized protein n=1 Tax=Diploscapter pachys TaxID=2018661 RepID=A0A2A2K2D1_9BILA|nr:hypothetical protein WR25_23257 [Diploscapter pachys]
MHALDGRRRSLCHRDAGARRSGKAHHVDAGVSRQRRADCGAVAVDEVEDTRGYARLVQDFGEDHRTARRFLGRLENHRIAGGERGRDLGANLVERPVPRRDHRDDADRVIVVTACSVDGSMTS